MARRLPLHRREEEEQPVSPEVGRLLVLGFVIAALATMLAGAGALRYQATGKRPFEFLIIVFGVATVASGFAMFRDGVMGSREFLWMLPAKPVAAVAAGARDGSLSPAQAHRAAAVLDLD